MPDHKEIYAKDKKRCRLLAKLRQYTAAVIVSLLGLANGTTFGWPSPIIPLLKSPQSPILEEIDSTTIALIGSLPFAGAVVGSFFLGTLTDRMGRKTAATLLAIPYITSWLMVTFANNSLWILIARFIQGFGNTGSVISVPVFLSEIAQDNIRGFMGSLFTTAMCAGALFSYVIGAYFGYYVLAISCLAIPCIFLLTFIWLPESPMYLWSVGEEDKSIDSLLWYRGGDVDETEKDVAKYKLMPERHKEQSLSVLCATRGTKNALKIGIVLMAAMQGCGFFVILTYAVEIFKHSGTTVSPYDAAIVLATVRLLSSICSSMLADCLGRRTLVISSQIIMAISLTIIGTCWAASTDKPIDSFVRWIPIYALYANTAAFQLGVGALAFVIISETFPLEIRGLATSKLSLIECGLGFTILQLFPSMIQLLHPHGTFFLYGFLCLVFGIFFYIYLPETMNIAQNEILDFLNKTGDTIHIKTGEVQPLRQVNKATAFYS